MGHAGSRVPCGDCRYRSSSGERTSGEPQRCPPARYALCTSTSVRNAPPHDCNDHITRPSPQHDGAMGLSLRWSHSGPGYDDIDVTALPAAIGFLHPSSTSLTTHLHRVLDPPDHSRRIQSTEMRASSSALWVLHALALAFTDTSAVAPQDVTPPLQVQTPFAAALAPHAGAPVAWEQAADRAAKLVKDMTLEEKLNVTSGRLGPCQANSGSVPRLGIPSFCYNDGRECRHRHAQAAGGSVRWNQRPDLIRAMCTSTRPR